MTQIRRLRFAVIFPAVCLILFALSGCGGRAVSVKGNLVLPPNLTLQESDQVAMSFQPSDSKEGGGGMAVYTPADKSFIVKSADGKGLPPGKYKVSVRIVPYPGSADSEKRAASFADLNAKYASGASLTYDVTDEATQNIVIDLDKGTITKK
jgi:predicted small lipoprotein YifL